MKSSQENAKNTFWVCCLLMILRTKREGDKIEFKAVSVKPSGVKLGVLGAGLYANATLLPAIKNINDIELVGIASSSGLHAQHSGKKFSFAYATSSDDEIINDANINTVAILTRHDTHADLVIKALKAGKNVFVEKPLAINRVQLSAVIKQLKNNQSLLTVGFNRRFAPLAQHLLGFYDDHTEPMHVHYRINAGYIPLNHWTQDSEQGGGRIIGEACHFIDFITFIVGASPVSVIAHALPDNSKYRDRQCLDDLHFSRWLDWSGRLSCQWRQVLFERTRRSVLRRQDRGVE